MEAGPRAALKQLGLGEMTQSARKVWVEEAGLDTLLGSNASPLRSLRSEQGSYIAFVGMQLLHSAIHGVGSVTYRRPQGEAFSATS